MAPHQIIAIVDDDSSVREATSALMKALGYRSAAFRSAEEFLESETRHAASFLIADVRMPGMSGFELYRSLVRAGRAIPTILITAHGDERMCTRAIEEGVVGFLNKPFNESELLGYIAGALSPDGQNCARKS